MAQNKLKAAILIVSDTASSDPTTDKCIPVLQEVFGDEWDVVESAIVPDDKSEIESFIKKWTDSDQYASCIVTSGGTGFAVKDNTPEAVSPLLHKQAPGLVYGLRSLILKLFTNFDRHAMLAPSLAITPFAMMARPVAGVRNKTIIITLPGSPKGAKENLEAIVKLLPHACQQAAGMNSRALHSGGIKKLEKEAGVASNAASGGTHSHDHHHHHHDHSHGGGHKVPRAHTKPEARPVPNDPSAGPTQRHRKSPWPMLSVDEALDLIKEHTPKPEVAKMSVNERLVGHVVAESVAASESVPAFRASIVDGYAVRIPASGTFEKGTYPVALVSHAQAGEVPELKEGQIARITTGAPLPPGSSAVVMVEDTVLVSQTEDGSEEKEVEILTSEIKDGENVREVGSDVQKGDTIIHKGQTISAIGGELGLLASVGVPQVLAYRKPIVGVLSTGDEIIPHDEARPLKLGEVRDTNRPTLLTAIAGTGFEAIDLGIASDKPGTLEETLRAAFRRTDIVITTGGVSMGELDLLKPTITRALGGTIHFGRVAMKPGKPTTFASVQVKDNDGKRVTKLIFGLPGNSASAIVTFHLFVLPALHHASGIEPAGLPRVKVVVDRDVKRDPERSEYHRVVVTAGRDGYLHAVSTGGQRSSRVGSFMAANGLLCLPAEKGVVAKGEMVDALLMGKIVSEL
ncbi:hypothetical protein BT63DRAFT_384699 [Microthyrium microscopicum]|uniref:MoaB/Mog domain-containing protein n=1 Tax=Microthyrium microscopicum TaxID=703497 RepID=A0A6A6UJ13_9PEZI|nr:hypothetical protein BT63DRAFT_384699 [Microthyrium microscopicum]